MPIPHLAVGDILKLTARAVSNQQTAQIDCHFRVSAIAGLSVSVQDVANEWVTLTDAQWPSVLAPTAFGDRVTVELFNSATGKVLISADGATTIPVGTVGTAQAPTQASAVVTKNTGYAGQAFRGRCYVPFVPMSFLTPAGEFNAAARAAYGPFVTLLFGTQSFGVLPNTASLTPVIVHRPGVKFPLPLQTVDILNFIFTDKVGTQRRRGDYGIPNVP